MKKFEGQVRHKNVFISTNALPFEFISAIQKILGSQDRAHEAGEDPQVSGSSVGLQKMYI